MTSFHCPPSRVRNVTSGTRLAFTVLEHGVRSPWAQTLAPRGRHVQLIFLPAFDSLAYDEPRSPSPCPRCASSSTSSRSPTRRTSALAASHCHVSQPGLSTQVREVEQLLGVRLFERDRRGVIVTPAGEDDRRTCARPAHRRPRPGRSRAPSHEAAGRAAAPRRHPDHRAVLAAAGPARRAARPSRTEAAAARGEDRACCSTCRPGQDRRRAARDRRAARRRGDALPCSTTRSCSRCRPGIRSPGRSR